jgi:hypothetical protein
MDDGLHAATLRPRRGGQEGMAHRQGGRRSGERQRRPGQLGCLRLNFPWMALVAAQGSVVH